MNLTDLKGRLLLGTNNPGKIKKLRAILAPLKFLGLLDKPSERGALVIKVGLMLYDAYTRKQGTVPPHRFEGKDASHKRFPELHPDVRYTATYYDGSIRNPERYVIELLLDAEADVNTRENSGATPLSYAPFRGFNEMIDVLLDYGA